MTQGELDRSLLIDAYAAAARSPDPSTQNGAILVNGNLTVSACNRFPWGILQSQERLQGPGKYRFIEHAERNVIYHAARCGVETLGATLYCPWFSCTECARAIIQAGIVRVVGHWLEDHEERYDWQETVTAGREMLVEAGVVCDWISDHLGCGPIRFNGQMIYP